MIFEYYCVINDDDYEVQCTPSLLYPKPGKRKLLDDITVNVAFHVS